MHVLNGQTIQMQGKGRKLQNKKDNSESAKTVGEWDWRKVNENHSEKDKGIHGIF